MRYQEDHQDDYSDSAYWEEDCCVCISRNFVFWCNVTLLIFGLAAVGYSIYLWLAPDLEWAGEDLALRFTIFAAFLIIIALIGMTGTWDEVERCDLIVYLILIIGIITGQIAFVIYFATNQGSVKGYLQEFWDDWSDARKEESMKSYDCGLYHDSSYNVTGESDVIINEDPLNIENCVNDDETFDYCFEDCWDEASDAISTIGTLTSTFLILFALLELMLLISTIILVCNPAEFDYEYEEEYVQPRQPKPREQARRPVGPPREQRGYYGQRAYANVQTRGQTVY